MKNFLIAMVLSFLVAAPAMAKSKKPADDSIVTTAINDGRFTILVDLVVTAGLAGVLDEEGQFTVFAPTDDAFEETFGEGVTAGDIVGVIAGACIDVIGAAQNVLLHHVADGRRWSNSVVGKNTKPIDTLNGELIWVRNDGSIRDASGSSMADIVIPDVNASNGIVHALDYVLMPSSLCVD
jgi:uncharacterized surface protein with fasciclin (FAS1) repeats